MPFQNPAIEAVPSKHTAITEYYFKLIRLIVSVKNQKLIEHQQKVIFVSQ